MDNEGIQRYINDRYATALNFYDTRAAMFKGWYRRLTVYVIVMSAILTPFVSLVPSEMGWRIASAALSASIVIGTSLLAYFRCHENWLSYRASWDALKREREFLNAMIHEYGTTEDPNALFVERVEAILSKEATEFYSRHLKAEEQARETPKKK